ncbi:MAG: hypothetical protein NT027_18100 [Proteobacteria bacterium]|nr:hypothetical protein [Pseudomonadota bacterium]
MLNRKIVRLVSFTLFMGATYSGCGTKVESHEIKEYRVALASSDSKFKPIIKSLVSDYNSKVGFRAMEFVDSVDQANSRIVITEGLEKRDGKVGWGQWFVETERNGLDLPGSAVEKTSTYSFEAEFDADFVKSNSDIQNGVIPDELAKLWAHEIGHGFLLDHHPDERNVMYYDIAGEKDFSKYWPEIRKFFGR